MKRFLLALVAFVCVLCLTTSCSQNHPDVTTIDFIEIESVPVVEGVGLSAPFSGTDGSTIFIAGGCNFPQTAASDGGEKRFYDHIYLYDAKSGKNGKWQLSDAKLPVASAYGVSVVTSEGTYLFGGTADGKGSLTSSLLFKNGKFEKLADMPFGLDNGNGVAIGNDIYIVGGLSNGTAVNTVLVFDTKKGTWKEALTYPGEARVQPVVVSQNAAEETKLYVIGGFNPETLNVMHDGWAFSPKLGTWSKIASAPVPLIGGVGFKTGVHTVVATGGVNAEKFALGLAATSDSLKKAYMTHEPQWYNFNDTLWAYNTIVDRWCETGVAPVARAGAALIPTQNGWFYVMGESMPGVRSNQAFYGEIHSVQSFGWINWTVIIVYLLAMLGLGFIFMFRSKNADDYFKAGGRIPWWAVSVSIFATMLSAITFMAIPAKTYATDWRYFMMAITIFIAAFPVVKYYLPFFRRLKITSAYEYLELRFNRVLRIISSILFIIFMTARMALVLYLPSLALTAATGIDVYTCILLMSLITIIYSSIGGIEAVVWGDVVQGIILMGGGLFTLGYLIVNTDGNAWQIAVESQKFNLIDLSFSLTSPTLWVMVIGGFAIQLISYTSDQTVIQRYMTAKSEKQSGKSIITNGILSVISSIIFYAIGTALFTYFQSRPETLDISMPTADSIFPFFIMTQLPVGVAGILIAAIFAASMSTVSSNINSIATAFTVDIYPLFKPKKPAGLKVARITSVAFGAAGCLFALMMATWNILSLFDWFNTMLGLLTSGLGALFFMGIFFPRIDGRSAMIGFFSGTALLILITIYTPLSFWLYGLFGIVAITAISLIASFTIPGNKKPIIGLTWSTIKKDVQKD